MIMLIATCAAQASGGILEGWTYPRELSDSGDAISAGPKIAVDSYGNPHAIWMESEEPSEPERDVCYVSSGDMGTIWSDASKYDTDSDSSQGALTLDASDKVHVCWWEMSGPEFEVFYNSRSGPGWDIEETVVVTASDTKRPSVAVASDYVYVVWSNKPGASHAELYYSRRGLGGGDWYTATIVADTSCGSLYPNIAMDAYGNLHIVWQENSEPHKEVMYISGTVQTDGSLTFWSSPVTVSTGLSQHATTPDIVVGDDAVHVVFGVDLEDRPYAQEVYYVDFAISSTDEISPSVIPGSMVTISQQLPTFASPSIALSGPDELHTIWNGMTEGDVSDRIYYASSEDGGASWSVPGPISADDPSPDRFPTIATDGRVLHVAWQQQASLSDQDIYYSRRFPHAYVLPLIFRE